MNVLTAFGIISCLILSPTDLLQSKQILFVTKQKLKLQCQHIPWLMQYLYLIFILKSNTLIKPKEKIFLHNEESNIHNIFHTKMFQQLLGNKHHR